MGMHFRPRRLAIPRSLACSNGQIVQRAAGAASATTIRCAGVIALTSSTLATKTVYDANVRTYVEAGGVAAVSAGELTESPQARCALPVAGYACYVSDPLDAATRHKTITGTDAVIAASVRWITKVKALDYDVFFDRPGAQATAMSVEGVRRESVLVFGAITVGGADGANFVAYANAGASATWGGDNHGGLMTFTSKAISVIGAKGGRTMGFDSTDAITTASSPSIILSAAFVVVTDVNVDAAAVAPSVSTPMGAGCAPAPGAIIHDQAAVVDAAASKGTSITAALTAGRVVGARTLATGSSTTDNDMDVPVGTRADDVVNGCWTGMGCVIRTKRFAVGAITHIGCG
mmetsp:Transcript_64693/g.179994  ORF Transcript_64693/g.179994 Transcript_64693/m.179994 type:complete len:347 (-) Transcript_64693:1240-2280(-)